MAGDAATAVLFFQHAFERKRDNENYLKCFLAALNITDPAAASNRADEILRDHARHSPSIIVAATCVQLNAAFADAGTQNGRRVFEKVEPIVKTAVSRLESQEPASLDRSSYVTALGLLGIGNQVLGKLDAALEFYSRGLLLDPYNDSLLVARGLLLYGRSPQAISDLEAAIGTGTVLVWPYVSLAHHNLRNGRFDESRRLCERALGMSGPAAVMQRGLRMDGDCAG